MFRAACVLALPVFLVGAYVGGIRYNSTDSMPVGWYWITPLRAVARGDIVIGCLPGAIAQKAITPCATGSPPLVKLLVGVAGDRYNVTPRGVFINGRKVAGPPQTHDVRGRQLVAATAGTVPPGAGFLVGTSRNSWDSRYYGPVDLTGFRAAAPIRVSVRSANPR